jgi:hypothetical protein
LQTAGLPRAPLGDGFRDLDPGGVESCARRHEGGAGRAVDSNEPEQKVLCTDVRVIELSSLLFCDLDNTMGPLAEAFHPCTIGAINLKK